MEKQQQKEDNENRSYTKKLTDMFTQDFVCTANFHTGDVPDRRENL